jgi:hypothetical protein
LTLGSSNAGTIALGSGDVQSNFLQPSFAARMSGAQTISHETYTKVDFDTEIFDTDSAYDHSTNQRFTVPSGKAGKYFFYTVALCDAGSAANLQNARIAFYKNGSAHTQNLWNFNSNDIFVAGMALSSVIDLSASDYVEVYARISDASGSPVVDGSASTYGQFLGYRIGT